MKKEFYCALFHQEYIGEIERKKISRYRVNIYISNQGKYHSREMWSESIGDIDDRKGLTYILSRLAAQVRMNVGFKSGAQFLRINENHKEAFNGPYIITSASEYEKRKFLEYLSVN